MRLKRIHWFEFHDLAWFPATFRDALTEWLHVLWDRIDAYSAIAPILAEMLHESRATRIVDLCSGASGPLLGIQREFKACGWDFKAVVTDKFPNVRVMRELRSMNRGAFDARLTSVDATAVPRELTGLRTLFNSFHHFRPLEAEQILQDAFDAGQPIGIFEIPNRTIEGVSFSFVATFLGVLLLTPTMRPKRPARWIFTYLLPIIPFTVAWDGWVSHLRAYTPDELLQMTCRFSESYRWETRGLSIRNGQYTVTCLLGVPRETTPVAAVPRDALAR
jgi:hypothetical protein